MGPLSRTGFSRHRTARWTSILKNVETVRSCMLLVDSGQMEWKWINLMNVLIKPHLWSFVVLSLSLKNFTIYFWTNDELPPYLFLPQKKTSTQLFTPRSFPLHLPDSPKKRKTKNKGGQKTMSCPSRSTCSDFTACPSTVTRPAAMEALDLTWWRPQLVGGDCFQAISKDTLPETNSLPLKVGRCPKGNFIFQPLSFQGLCC